MKKIISVVFLALGLVVIFAIGALAQTTVAGEWDATFSTPGGPQALKLILKVDGEKLSGTAKRARGDVAITGTIKGEDIAFSYTIEYNGNAVTVGFTGKVKGDSMGGTVSFNETAGDEWSAKRTPPKPKDKP